MKHKTESVVKELSIHCVRVFFQVDRVQGDIFEVSALPVTEFAFARLQILSLELTVLDMYWSWNGPIITSHIQGSWEKITE